MFSTMANYPLIFLDYSNDASMSIIFILSSVMIYNIIFHPKIIVNPPLFNEMLIKNIHNGKSIKITIWSKNSFIIKCLENEKQK